MADRRPPNRPSRWTKPLRSRSRLQQREEWVAAHTIYRTILDVVPDHPDAVHYSGVLAHQEGHSDERR